MQPSAKPHERMLSQRKAAPHGRIRYAAAQPECLPRDCCAKAKIGRLAGSR